MGAGRGAMEVRGLIGVDLVTGGGTGALAGAGGEFRLVTISCAANEAAVVAETRQRQGHISIELQLQDRKSVV